MTTHNGANHATGNHTVSRDRLTAGLVDVETGCGLRAAGCELPKSLSTTWTAGLHSARAEQLRDLAREDDGDPPRIGVTVWVVGSALLTALGLALWALVTYAQ